MKKGHPFIKWVGGKTQLLDIIRLKYPEKVKRYCEPFVGGGAILFDVLQTLHPEEVLINDINRELINTYNTIKTNVEDLINLLEEYQSIYLSKQLDEERKEYFYKQRTLFNSFIETNDSNHNLEKAALFIFLNKTCFNGLYRVNSKGLFNVSFNGAKNPLLCDKENLNICSELLQNVALLNGDYSACESFINKDTFVFIDPPYKPLTVTSSFTSYSKDQFSDQNQIELSNFIKRIASNGTKVLASNSDPKNTDEDDNFFDDLYSDFEIQRIYAKRSINSNGKKRGVVSELLISNLLSE